MSGIAVENPITGDQLYTVSEPSPEDIEGVYGRAGDAFERIRRMSVEERAAEAGKLKDYILKNHEHVVDRICEETGKCRMDALVLEVLPALDIIDYYQKNAPRILADEKVKTPLFMLGKKSYIYYEPIGPVLIISPWNYPFHLSFVPFVCAFFAGNPVVLKPSRYTPLRGLMEEITEKSGFVKDALQVVYATRKSADLLIEAKPAKIFFTGSVNAGKSVMAKAANHLIPVELELGGKDPMVVFDDVNVERTVNGALWGGMANSGQTCTSVERVYVQEGVYDAFVAALKEKAAHIRPLDVESGSDGREFDMGYMTAQFQIEEVEEQIADAKAKGAEIVCGGERRGNSHLYPPTIVTEANGSMRIVQEETFGPVITVTRFKTEDEAVAMANDSNLGLSASVWSGDIERAKRVARRLATGNVSINNVLATQGNSGLPFGGCKDSGFGRYRGRFGLESFSNIKSIVIDKQSSKLEVNWYPYSGEKYALFKELLTAAFGGGAFSLVKTLLAGLKLEALARRKRL